MKFYNATVVKMLVAIVSLTLFLSTGAKAQTRVKVETDMGDVFIKLYDDLAPLTVENFLKYVNSGAYDGNIFHRSLPGFVLQTGGYDITASGSNLLSAVSKGSPVVNEFGKSNLRGTIAMAKLGGDPNSATSEWFINLSDNSSNLDSQNGGFTVFGEIEDMKVVDEITSTRIVNIGGAFTNLPIKDLTHPDNSGATKASDLTRDDFVEIKKIAVVSSVPEPSSVLLFSITVLGSLVVRRR